MTRWRSCCATEQLVQRLLRARQQPGNVLGRHDEADELPVGDHGDVDTVHAASRIQRRSARHAAVDRTRVVDALLDAVLDQAVRDAFGDGQAQVQRKTDRPGALPLSRNLAAQLQGRQFEVVGRDDGEVVADVDGEYVQRPAAPVARQVFQPVLPWVQHGLRHHVVVGHDPAPVIDGETAAVECARFGRVEEAADLHHRFACRVEPDLRVARELLVRDVGVDGGRVRRSLFIRDGVRRLFLGGRAGRHLGGRLGGRLGRCLGGRRGFLRLRDDARGGTAQPQGGDEAGKLHSEECMPSNLTQIPDVGRHTPATLRRYPAEVEVTEGRRDADK